MHRKRYRYYKPLTKSDLAGLLGIFVLVLAGLSIFLRPQTIPHLLAVADNFVPSSTNTQDHLSRLDLKTRPSQTSIFSVIMPSAQYEPLQSSPASAGGAEALSGLIVGTPAPAAYRYFRFHGVKYVYWKTLRMRVTSYAPDRRCCWPFAGTTTASGASVRTNQGRLVAADTHIVPFHCLVSVPGYAHGKPVPVLDRGGAIRGYRLDVLEPDFYQARQWGSRLVKVKLFRPVEQN